MGMKEFLRVAWCNLKAQNVTSWCQSMGGFSGVAYPDLRLVEGMLQNGIRASVQNLAWMGQSISIEVNIHRRSNFKVTGIGVIDCPWKKVGVLSRVR